MPKFSSGQQIKIGTTISYINNAFAIISGLLYTPWLIRSIGSSDYGLYMLAISIITLVAMDFGIGSAVSRFMSKYRAEGDEDGAKKFLGTAFRLFTYIGIIIFTVLAVLYFFVDRIYIELTPEEIGKFKVLYIIFSLFTVIRFPFQPLNGVLISHEKFIFIKGIDLCHRVAVVCIMVAALLLGMGLYTLVMVHVVTGLAVTLIQLIYTRKTIGLYIDFFHRDNKLVKEIFAFSFWMLLITIFCRFTTTIMPSVLGITSGSAEITLFSIGHTIEGYIFTFSFVLSGMFVPRLSKIYFNGNATETVAPVQELMVRVGRLQFIVISVVLAMFVPIGYEFITVFWLGPDFAPTYIIILLLIMPYLVISPMDIASQALFVTSKLKYAAFGRIIIGVVSTAGAFIVSRYWGAVGAALSIFIGTVTGGVIFMVIVYQRVLHLGIVKLFYECHIKMGIPLIVTVLSGYIIKNRILITDRITFLINALILFAIFFLLLWFTALNGYEKGLARGFVNKAVSVIKKT